MYQVIIVDDEKHVREGLAETVKWAEYQMLIAGIFINGREALDYIRKFPVDIIFSDVRMPEMDGLELCRTVCQSYESIQFVFISGYSDIDYLKAAISSSAVDYLFKPVNMTELYTLLDKLRIRKEHEATKQKTLQEMQQQLLESLPLLREKFLGELISTSIDGQSIEKRCRFLGLPIWDSACYQLVVINVDNSRLFFSPMDEQQIQLFSIGVTSLCKRIVQQSGGGLVFAKSSAEYILLFLSELPAEQLMEWCEDLQCQINFLYGSSVTIGLTHPIRRLVDISKSYQKALQAIDQRLYLGKSLIIHFDILESETQNILPKPLSLDTLRRLLATANLKEADWLVEQTFQQALNCKGLPLAYLQNLCMQIILTCQQAVCELDSHHALALGSANLGQQAFMLETIDDMQKLVQSCTAETCGFILERKRTKRNNVITLAQQLIGENYGKHITISDLAEKVYLSPQYLCILFKQQTGETINDYITRLRMEKAQQLLRETNYKLTDISAQVGYSDSSYFTKQFKKITGFTPSDYRNLPG